MSMFIARDHNREKDNTMIMDSGSTTNSFEAGERHLLQNFRWVEKGVKIKCNKGMVETHWKADYKSFEAWYFEDDICNIMLLDVTSQKYWITFNNNDRGGVCKVHTPIGLVEFQKGQNGLYCLDMAVVKKVKDDTDSGMGHNFMIETICCNYEGYITKEIERAYCVR